MITILTLELHQQKDRWLGRREIVVSELLKRKPDLIAFQDVNVVAGQANWILRQLNARLGEVHYQLLQQRHRSFWGGQWSGVAILTSFPIILQEVLELGYRGQVALLANVELPTGDTIDFVTVQLVNDLHLPDVRLEQTMRLAGWLQQRGRSPYQILAGGFNAHPESQTVKHLKQVYDSAYEEVIGYEPLATYPTALAYDQQTPASCRDYIFVSRQVRPQRVDLVGRRLHSVDRSLFISTHVGISTEIQLRPNV